MPMVKIRTRVLPGSVSSRAALAMISIRLRAALLMFQIWLGYLPAVSRRRPRVELCATPLTVSVLVCSGNVVGMPALRWKLCGQEGRRQRQGRRRHGQSRYIGQRPAGALCAVRKAMNQRKRCNQSAGQPPGCVSAKCEQSA